MSTVESGLTGRNPAGTEPNTTATAIPAATREQRGRSNERNTSDCDGLILIWFIAA